MLAAIASTDQRSTWAFGINSGSMPPATQSRSCSTATIPRRRAASLPSGGGAKCYRGNANRSPVERSGGLSR